jgi:oligopeptide/dipeptide ABC transporter ATP-binding protein
MSTSPPAEVLRVQDLRMHFPMRRRLPWGERPTVKAVDGVSFHVRAGETFCIVGESGSGKSTVGRLALRLLDPTAGRIVLNGEDISTLSAGAMRARRRGAQMVFQDPYASLNPRLDALTIVAEPLENFADLSRAARAEKVREIFGRVGLPAEALHRRPFEFSGGQRQRLAIARALSVQPSLIVADEPVSALDVSVQAQVLNLLMDLQESLGLAYLFISHDLRVVQHIGHNIAVMYLGRLCELAPKETFFAQPLHPYSEALIASAPAPDPRRRRRRALLEGDIPSPMRPPPGCRFHTRCPIAVGRCSQEEPELREAAPGHFVACHLRGAAA